MTRDAEPPGGGAIPLTLVASFAQQTDVSTAIRLAAVCFIATLTAVAAQVSIPLPLTPVPLTLQSTVVLLGGATLGWRLGALAQIVYLLAGIAGLPAFAFSSTLGMGLTRLLGPTGGYLLSFPIAAAVTGALAERGWDRRYGTQVLAMGAGLVVVYVGGVVRLAAGPPAPLGLEAALVAGVFPFVVMDVLELGAGAALLPVLWRFLTVSPGGKVVAADMATQPRQVGFLTDSEWRALLREVLAEDHANYTIARGKRAPSRATYLAVLVDPQTGRAVRFEVKAYLGHDQLRAQARRQVRTLTGAQPDTGRG